MVTRSRAQASGLADRLTTLGADVVELPVITIEAPADGGKGLAGAVRRLVAGEYRWVVLTSSNAVGRLVEALGGRAGPGSVRWAAVGPGTARAMERAGLPVDLVPTASVAEALVEVFPVRASGSAADAATATAPEPTATVLFPRAETVRGALADGLRAKGWRVDEVVAYRTVAGDPSPEAVLAAGQADGVAFTSSSTVRRALELLRDVGVPPVVVTIGPVTTGSARSAGLDVAAEADPHTIDGLVEAVVAVLGNRSDLPAGGRSSPRGPARQRRRPQ